MRRIGILLLSLVFLLCACQKAPADVLDVTDAAPAPAEDSASVMHAAGVSGALTVLHTAAYVFEGGEGAMLYGAVEFRNDMDASVWISGMRFDFSGEQEITQSFVPSLAAYDRIDPGDVAYAAAWFPQDTLTPGAAVTLTAALSYTTQGGDSIPLTVSDLFLADNYPAFTTMTGTLTNETDGSCALNMVYTAFYDAGGAFLGVWYFPVNAQLDSMDSVRFATHLRSFPIEKLSERAASCKGRAFGFN